MRTGGTYHVTALCHGKCGIGEKTEVRRQKSEDRRQKLGKQETQRRQQPQYCLAGHRFKPGRRLPIASIRCQIQAEIARNGSAKLGNTNFP
jgi:hypothetical protein